MNLYFISGLGAEKRIFQNLVLPEVFKIHYIEWVAVSENETMESYCRRLSTQINQQEPFSIVGLSFGGVIAIEMSKVTTTFHDGTVDKQVRCFAFGGLKIQRF